MVLILEDFGQLEVREVTIRLDGEIEITDRTALFELDRFLVADIVEALLVPYDDDWYISVCVEELEGFEGVFDTTYVYKVIG